MEIRQLNNGMIRSLGKVLRTGVALATLALGLGGAQNTFAMVTTLTFDNLPSGVAVDTQYQSLGVSFSGAIATNAAFTPWSANSGLNVAYSPTGGIVLALNPAIIGFVQSGSVYISGETSIELFAYDFGGALVGQFATPGATDSYLLPFFSSGNPMEFLVIHDGGSSFTIDTLTLVSTAAVPEPSTTLLLSLGLLGMIGVAKRKAVRPKA